MEATETVGDVDTSINKKELIQKRIESRNESRQLKAEQQKQNRESLKVDGEKCEHLLDKIKEQLACLHESINKIPPPSADRNLVIEHFDKLQVSHTSLQTFFNNNYTYLPSFHTGHLQAQIKEVQESISKKRGERLPKKKFAFKGKKKTISTAQSAKKENNDARVENLASKAASFCQDIYVVKNRTDEEISLTAGSIKGRDISFTDLKNCKVILHGAPATVHICNSDSCTFEIGPVSGSVFVDRCTSCKISSGCQQLRIHHTSRTTFRVHVTSRCIIEDTSDVQFGDYDVDYPGIDADFEHSSLDRNTNNWRNVDDFNWLAKDSVSPNFTLIES